MFCYIIFAGPITVYQKYTFALFGFDNPSKPIIKQFNKPPL